MSSTVSLDRLLTAGEFACLPDDGWHTELVRGRVIREPQPAYEHGRIQMRMGALLARHVEHHAPDLVCVGPFGVITEEAPDTVRGPDLAVLRQERARELHRAGFLRGAPELAVEVVSPSNGAADIQAKVSEYVAAGAEIVWVIYPETRTVVVYDSPDAARFLSEDAILTGGELLPELRIPVSEIFRD